MDSAISAEIDPDRVNIVIPEDFVMPEEEFMPAGQTQPLNRNVVSISSKFTLRASLPG